MNGVNAMDADQRAAILAPTTDFSKPEAWEALQGGTATNRKRLDREAFSQPSSSLTFEERANFFVGDGLFKRLWVSAPSSTRSADGLGPLYNARACQRCHLKDGRGHPPESVNDSAVSMLLRLSIPPKNENERAALMSRGQSARPEPVYGGQLQDLALPGHTPEGRLVVSYEETEVRLADGETVSLRKPTYAVAELGYGPMADDVGLSPRVAQPMIGLGLLEAISDEDILANVDADDADGDGISGQSNLVWSIEKHSLALGRFGWKAGQPSLREQMVAASSGDMGISSALRPQAWGDCTQAQADCRDAPHGDTRAQEGVEASDEIMDVQLLYTRNLAVPARRNVGDEAVLRGKSLFYGAGCTGCHTPKFATRLDYEVKALAGQLIWPYTDLLLHDMGEGLADNAPEAAATGTQWRTPPLWGIGLTRTVNGHTYFLHDGRARNLTEAILWHGGEALPARDAFASMPRSERNALLAFLSSL